MTVTSKWVALHEVSDYLAKGWREVQIIGGPDDAALMVSPEELASEPAKVECPNCLHEDTDHAWKVNGELRYSCAGWNKPAQPEPAVAMTEELKRLLAICEDRAIDADENEYPKSAEFIRADIAAVRAQAAEAGKVEDDAESFVWRRGYETGLIDASRPARVRMTDELERLMEAARARAWDCHASGNMSRCEDIRADIAAVRSQAAEAGKGSRKILSEALVASQLRVEQLEAEAGKVRLPKVRELFEHVQHYPMTVNGREILRLAIKEADAAEGRK